MKFRNFPDAGADTEDPADSRGSVRGIIVLPVGKIAIVPLIPFPDTVRREASLPGDRELL